jgi:hypothetical protein
MEASKTGSERRRWTSKQRQLLLARFKHLSLQTEEQYWDWVVRFLRFHRGKAEWLKVEMDSFT